MEILLGNHLHLHLTELSLKGIDDKFVWHPYTQMRDWIGKNQPVIVRGRGFYLVDSDGKEYLDGTSSMWCNVWGHDQNPVVKAMQDQLDNLQHSTLFGLANETSALLAQRLVKIARGLDKVFYTDNGSTAIEASMKMAVQYWKNKGKPKKKEFLSLENGYHGDTIGAMSLGYIEKFFGAYKPLLSPIVRRVPSPLLYGSGEDSLEALVNSCLTRLERSLKSAGDRCAALVMESGAQIAGGVIIYPPGFQSEVARLCRKYDVLLILDEIATGFGRLGNMVEYGAQKSPPDIACFGKALTGGYFPLAAVLATDSIFDAFVGEYSDNKQFYHGHTFTGHPVGCAAALANLDLYERQGLIQKIRENGRYIGSRLKGIQDSSLVADIRHKGMLAGIELANNGKPLLTLHGERLSYFVMRESLKCGVYLRPLGNILTVIPPLAINRTDLQKLMDAHEESLRRVEKSLSH
jgi:adenosylmethionine-8-amino-7-oxononanoate aminotransferase